MIGCENKALYINFGLLCTILLLVPAVSHELGTILPPSWAGICSFTQDGTILGLYVDNVTGERVFSVRCYVGEHDVWSFSTLQAWLKGFAGFSVFLTVECDGRGTISLPWPMKARGLVGLKVTRCRLKEKYADVLNPDVSALPDQLRVMDMRDSVWLSDKGSFEFMIQPEVLMGMSADYDCGQDNTIEYMVISNVTDSLDSGPPTAFGDDSDTAIGSVKTSSNKAEKHIGSAGASLELAPVSSTISRKSESTSNLNDLLIRQSQSPNMSNTLAVSLVNPTSGTANNVATSAESGYQELLKNIQLVQHTCVFKRLQLLDESYPSVMPVHHFSIMVQSGSYPELRTMNYSFSGLPEIPRELREFRTFFPKLAYLDLTKNLIRHVTLPKPPITARSQHLSLDLRYNHITHINLSMVQSWAAVKDVFVDVRFNPLDCDCHMDDLLRALKKTGFFKGPMAAYKYLKELRCYSPLSLRGKRISSIELSCSARVTNSLAAQHAENTNLSRTNLTVLLVFSGLAFVILTVVAVIVVLYIRKYGFAGVKGAVKADILQSGSSSTDIERTEQSVSGECNQV